MVFCVCVGVSCCDAFYSLARCSCIAFYSWIICMNVWVRGRDWRNSNDVIFLCYFGMHEALVCFLCATFCFFSFVFRLLLCKLQVFFLSYSSFLRIYRAASRGMILFSLPLSSYDFFFLFLCQTPPSIIEQTTPVLVTLHYIPQMLFIYI